MTPPAASQSPRKQGAAWPVGAPRRALRCCRSAMSMGAISAAEGTENRHPRGDYAGSRQIRPPVPVVWIRQGVWGAASRLTVMTAEVERGTEPMRAE
jgi:hypothetical protein